MDDLNSIVESFAAPLDVNPIPQLQSLSELHQVPDSPMEELSDLKKFTVTVLPVK